jgi:hypothetical protein
MCNSLTSLLIYDNNYVFSLFRFLVRLRRAYGSKGLPRRGIPPDSSLQYDVTLISINGLAVPTR